jgi:catechol-2,3-dioxygenase
MIKARRIRHATMITPDLERQVEYFQSIVGLGVAERDGNRVLMSSDSEQLSLVLERRAQPRCARLAFETSADIDIPAAQRWLAERGIKSDTSTDYLPGIAQILTVTDPEGGQIELFANGSTLPAPTSVGGLAVMKLGHVAMYTGDPQTTSKFYGEVLGFRVSDWIEESFVFMRCGFEHHTLNFARGSERRLHHIAFELRDSAHMQQACDLLGRKRIEILWGPVRHGPGHNVAIYHRNPDGQLVEFFFDMDRMVDEELGYYDPRPWHRDRPQRPKVWRGLPRDIWGLPPLPVCREFARKPAQPVG